MKKITTFLGLWVLFLGVNILFNLLFREPITLRGIGLDVLLTFMIYFIFLGLEQGKEKAM